MGIFGRRNVGKSSLINALTDQDLAIVSETPGTTTDPVHKAMEIHGLGPLVVIDTGGIDDTGELGRMRVQKAYKVLNKTDVALLVLDKGSGLTECDERFLHEVSARKIPAIVVLNKSDRPGENGPLRELLAQRKLPVVEVSALRRTGMDLLRQEIRSAVPEDYERKEILKDLVSEGDIVIMVAPMDIEAPKGRLKLPQVQTIRDALDTEASVMIVKEHALKTTLATLRRKPRLVITESQVFEQVARDLPEDIPLTSFSILFARYKGDLEVLSEGAQAVDRLEAGSRVLVAEACTHHPIGEDVGRVLIPDLLKKRTGLQTGQLAIDYVAGYEFPQEVSGYDLVVHCGGCMLNRREMMHRTGLTVRDRVPVTNYGIPIAHCHGILERALGCFAHKKAEGVKTGFAQVLN